MDREAWCAAILIGCLAGWGGGSGDREAEPQREELVDGGESAL